MDHQDTIVAISTPIGEGAIGIVRLSGDQALEILTKVAQPIKKSKKWEQCRSHSIHNAYLLDLRGEIFDEALVMIMRAPRTYTAEDIIEVNCHGGMVAVGKTLEAFLHAGARLAEPGEFTKRAFLNGRIDLAQAESVIDVIRAKTDFSLKMAMGQLEGKLSEKINTYREKLKIALGAIEAKIDFPENDIPEYSREHLKKNLQLMIQEINQLLKGGQRGKIFRDGLKAVIVGKPNVGKSSLLNALLDQNRALVTEIPGTTRDVIKEMLNIKGIPVLIMDTAGIRDSADQVEKLGVELARSSLRQASVVLFVLDATTGWEKEDQIIAREICDESKETIVLINKIDLVHNLKWEEAEAITGQKPLYISAKKGIGIHKLENEIFQRVMEGKTNMEESVFVSKTRHLLVLEEAKNFIKKALLCLDKGFADDFLSIDLHAAWEKLGEITGETVKEEIIDYIFNEFCIGK